MAKSIKFKNDTYLDSTSIVHNKKKLSDILTLLVNEHGVINSNEMITVNHGGTDIKYYDLIFKNKYNNTPTVLTTFLSEGDTGYYGFVPTYVVNYTNTKCTLMLGANLSDTRAKVGYFIISND